MKQKDFRLMTEKRLIKNHNISSHEEMLALLAAEGIYVTQATMSRDMKELRIIKKHNPDGGYCYAFPADLKALDLATETSQNAVSGVLSLEFSSNIGVIRTSPGYASMVCAVIDSGMGDEIMGTIAGDDTLMLILRKPSDKANVISAMDALMPGVKSKLVI